MRVIRAAVAAAVLVGSISVSSFAQQRPLVTEDAACIGSGRILLEFGTEWSSAATYPASGLTGDLLRVPVFGVSFGVASNVELQIDGGHSSLAITERGDGPFADVVGEGSSASDFDDIVVATKVRLVSETEGRPAFGVQIATKLPIASNESGLGLDTIDVHLVMLVAKSFGRARFAGNLGFGMLSDPTRGDKQNDVMPYGVSLTANLTERLQAVAEAAGRIHTSAGGPPPGTEGRGQARAGIRYGSGNVRFDAGVLFGYTSHDPEWGLVGGISYVADVSKQP
jgi:hypothetical protein